MKKEGQITLFLILGIGVIIAVGLLFVIAGSSSKKMSNPQLPPTVKKVQKHVEMCLFDTAMRGISLLGKQGGIIYESQNGTVPDSMKDKYAIEHDGNFIWNAIVPGSITYGRSCSPNHIGTDLYKYESCPSVTFPFAGENSPRIVFGIDDASLIAHDINDSQVSNVRLMNNVNIPGLYEKNDVTKEVEWTQVLLSPQYKIIRNLARYIETGMTSCLNLSQFNVQGLNITPEGDLEVTPVFSQEFTTINLNYPLRVYNLRTKQETMLTEFSTTSRVRFGKIYKYLYDILSKEAKDFSYLLSEAESDEGISVELEKDVEGKVDLVRIRDNKSWLPEGNDFTNYEFLGSIPNSPPSLSYIHYRNITSVPGLAADLRDCGSVYNSPAVDGRLTVRVFEKMDRQMVECIFNSYESRTGIAHQYKYAYDPDDYETIEWEFKTSGCDWNSECRYDNESEFVDMKSYLTLKVYETDGPYEDFLTIPLQLYNYPPEDIVVDFFEYDAPFYVYEVKAKNQETGIGMDELTLDVNLLGEDITFWGHDTSPNDNHPPWSIWRVYFENKTGYNDEVEFIVEDYFGDSTSTIETITIP